LLVALATLLEMSVILIWRISTCIEINDARASEAKTLTICRCNIWAVAFDFLHSPSEILVLFSLGLFLMLFRGGLQESQPFGFR